MLLQRVKSASREHIEDYILGMPAYGGYRVKRLRVRAKVYVDSPSDKINV